METKSIFEKDLKANFSKLNKNLECDVLIIGGGLAGVLTAFYLQEHKKQVFLVERNTIASATTSKMTAKVTVLQDILSKISKDKITTYIKSQLEGMKLLEENVKKLNLECDFLKNTSYLYTSKKSNVKKLKNLKKIFEDLNYPLEENDVPIKEFSAIYSLSTNNSYEINPVSYINGIVSTLDKKFIFENTDIIEVLKDDNHFICKTSSGFQIISQKVIFASHYPYFLKPLFFPLKVGLEKSYITYAKSKYKGNYNLINIDKKVHSVRFYKNNMIYLTGSTRISHAKDLSGYEQLKQTGIQYNSMNLWSNIDIVTNDHLPLIGEFLKDMYLITGFNTWGILSSHIGALTLASLISKNHKYIKYRNLFDPRRKVTLQKSFNSSLNIYENMHGYFKGIITKNRFIYYGKTKAIYLDQKGKCYQVSKVCPHLYGHLVFNEVEKIWECPCHGSRFKISGEVISGPSKYSICDKK